MKRIIIPLAALMVSSCIVDPLYIRMSGTYWSYSKDEQTARVCFEDDYHTSVLQYVESGNSYGSTQAIHGTYTTDGHQVLLSGNNWTNDIKFVRTFSHLKNNSTSKNLTPLKPQSYSGLGGSVWASMVNGDFEVAWFSSDGKCNHAVYKNVPREEGKPYGWQWHESDYTINGNQLCYGDKSATLFEDFMVIDTLAVLRAAPVTDDSATDALTGTFWTALFQNGNNILPGAIVFNGTGTFTRFIVASEIVYQARTGSYTFNGESITLTLNDKEETCPLGGDRFTYSGLTFTKTTPESLP